MVERVTTATAYTASTSTAAVGFLGMAVSDWGILVGIVGTVLTVCVNWYYRARDDRRKEARAQLEREIFEAEK
jgi:hypothetical protein